jgi:4'-phosphopantetheinyl transferase
MNPGWHVEIPIGRSQSIEIHMIELDAYYVEASDTLRDVLSGEELDRAAKFATAKLQHRYMAAQHFLRTVLAKCVATSPWAIGYSFNDFGKPFLKNASMYFNLSHSANFAAVGFSREREIGIDIETGVTLATTLEVSPGILTPNEMNAWKRIEVERKVSVFTEYWILKEAILKACGQGLSQNPRSIELLLDANPPCLKSLPADLGNEKDWSIGTHRFSQDTPRVAWALRG